MIVSKIARRSPHPISGLLHTEHDRKFQHATLKFPFPSSGRDGYVSLRSASLTFPFKGKGKRSGEGARGMGMGK